MNAEGQYNSKEIFDELLSRIKESFEWGEIYNNIPCILGRYTFSINDEEVSVLLVRTDEHYCIWTVRGNRYHETILCDKSADKVSLDHWMDVMRTDRHYAVFRQVLERFISDTANLSEAKHMDEDGIEFITSMAITESLGQSRKLPTICIFAFYGTIIPGLKGLEDYCRSQDDNSSPYILKAFFKEVDEYCDEHRVSKYLICRDGNDAVRCMDPFFYLGDGGLLLDDALNCDRPPLVSYTEGQNYLTLV